MAQIGGYVPVAAVYPEVKNGVEVLRNNLQQLGLSDALLWCARLNLLVSSSNGADIRQRQEYALCTFFTQPEIDRINNHVRAHGGVDKIRVFFRGQLLELMCQACVFCEERAAGSDFERPDVRQRFAQSALISSDLWSQRVYPQELYGHLQLEEARKQSLSELRRGIEGSLVGADLHKSLSRKKLFQEYFPKFYPDYESEFQTATDLSTDEYYCCLSAVMAHGMINNLIRLQTEPQTNLLMDLDKFYTQHPKMAVAFKRFFEIEGQSVDELKEGFASTASDSQMGFRHILKRPILRTPDGTGIVMDPLFFSAKAALGPLFHLVTYKPQKTGLLFSALGNAFEKYTTDALSRMYPPSAVGLANRLACNVQGNDRHKQPVQITDACLNDVTEAIFIEIKSAVIPDEVVWGDDAKDYPATLRERYGATEKDGKPSDKGVAQLAKTIRNLASGEWTTVQQDFSKLCRVFPVLVCMDPLMDAPLHGWFLARQFASLLKPGEPFQHNDMQVGRFLVASLTLITIDDLEILEDSIQEFCFRQMLRDYTNTGTFCFRDFLFSSEYGKKLRPCENVRKEASNVMRHTLTQLFSQADP